MNNFPSIKQVESKVHSNLNSLQIIKTYTNYIVNNKQCIKIKKKKYHRQKELNPRREHANR